MPEPLVVSRVEKDGRSLFGCPVKGTRHPCAVSGGGLVKIVSTDQQLRFAQGHEEFDVLGRPLVRLDTRHAREKARQR